MTQSATPGSEHPLPADGLPADLIPRIERAVSRYGAGEPVPAAEVRARLAEIGAPADAGYVDFLSRWGGCFVGVPVHGWGNASILGNETVVELTRAARAEFGDGVIDGLVIADDGAGNPIWISSTGPVKLVDHNSGFEVVELAPSFAAWIDANVHD